MTRYVIGAHLAAAALITFELGTIEVPLAIPVVLGLLFIHMRSIRSWQARLPKFAVAALATSPLLLAGYLLLFMTGCYESACDDTGVAPAGVFFGVLFFGLVLVATLAFIGVVVIGSLASLRRLLRRTGRELD